MLILFKNKKESKVLDAMTVLLMRMNGPNGSTTFIDETGKTVSTNGPVYVSTQKFKFDGASCYFNGGGGYLSLQSSDFSLEKSDFSIEVWVNPTYANPYPRILNCGNAEWGPNCWSVFSHHSSTTARRFVMYAYNYNGSYPILLGTTTVIDDQWYHLAITREGSVFRLFVNGIKEHENSFSGDLSTGETMTNLTVGGYFSGIAHSFKGNLDNLKITKGIALYKSNFNVPNEQ